MLRNYQIIEKIAEAPHAAVFKAYHADPSHPLSRLIRNAGETGQPLREIRLEALKPEHCHEMVSFILDRVECLAEQPVSLSSIGNFIKAIETANRGLAYFDKALPDGAEEVDRKMEKLVAEIAVKNIDIRRTILNMPFATDRKSQVEQAFYSELLADLYFSGRVPELYLVAAQATLHCLSAGIDESVIYAFTATGIYHAEQEEFDQSFIVKQLGGVIQIGEGSGSEFAVTFDAFRKGRRFT